MTVRSVRPKRLRGDAYALVVDAEYRRRGLRGLVTNRGSRRAEPWRALAVADLGSVIGPGDRMQLAYLTRPESPDELSYGVLRYQGPPGSGGQVAFGELNLSRNSPRTVLEGRAAEGELARFVLGLRAPLLRRASVRSEAEISFETVRSREEEDGRVLFEDALRVFRGTLRDRRHLGERARLTADIVVSAGLDGLGAEGASRPDGEAGFLTVAGEAIARAQVGRRVRAVAAVTAQVSDSPLLFQEEFSVGGGDYGRAYDFGEVRGDHGVAAYAEAGPVFRLADGAVMLFPYAYADAGVVWNEGAGLVADGRVLWSAGLGIEAALPLGFDLTYEPAKPLSDAPYTQDDEDLRHRLEIGWSATR